MRRNILEAKALEAIARLRSGRQYEDDICEFKGGWIDPYKAARRLAAHANSLHGEDGIWIIGINGKTSLSTNCPNEELAVWWAKVEGCFDGPTPSPTFISVQDEGSSFTALGFETDQAPYVIKNLGGGEISKEVPYRKGTSTFSASRSQLLRLLLPAISKPVYEFISAKAEITNEKDDIILLITLFMFVSPKQEDIVFPRYKASGSARLETTATSTALTKVQLTGPVDNRFEAFTLQSPGCLTLSGQMTLDRLIFDDQFDGDLSVKESEMSRLHIAFEFPALNPDHTLRIDRWLNPLAGSNRSFGGKWIAPP